MRKIILFLFILITQTLRAGTFEQFISYLNQLPVNERQAKVDSFMTANPILPFIENDTAVSFIYQGTATSVSIAGDFTTWNPSMPMIGISGTNFYYGSSHFESDARLDYKLVIDNNWILDPKNPHTCTGGFGPNSELRMPAYILPPEIAYYPNIPHGIFLDTAFYSTNLSNTRTIHIYLPPGYSVQHKYPVILFHDGSDYITLGNTANILDYLIAHNEIQPIIGVFVPPVDRQNEYAGSQKDAFTAFIVNELMPVIDFKYSTSTDPQKRATLGASDGGNIALYIGMKHPETFGKIGAQSSDVQSVISTTFQNSGKLNLEFYMDIGTYDIPVLIPLVNNFIQILQDKNYTYQFNRWHEGHSWGNWKGHLSLPLRQFFPPETGFNEINIPDNIRLYQNVPNPFTTATIINFNVPSNRMAEMTLYDEAGKSIRTIYKGANHSENNAVAFNSYGLRPGVYFYSLKVDQYLLSKKMNICN